MTRVNFYLGHDSPMIQGHARKELEQTDIVLSYQKCLFSLLRSNVKSCGEEHCFLSLKAIYFSAVKERGEGKNVESAYPPLI